MNSAHSAFVAALVTELGEDAVRTEADDLASYGADRCRGTWSIAPLAIALPRDVAQIQHVVRRCAAEGVAIVPSGGRTGLAGGAAASRGELVLSLERMRRILAVDASTRLLRCEPGATVEAVQLAAAEVGLVYPVDFAAKGSAQIGGSIATNAGGVRVLRYGSTRAWVSGLQVVIASGELLELGGALVKDNTGYDLRQLFIGAEGTLGVIAGATLRLTAAPAGAQVVLCALPDDAAMLALFDRVQRACTLQAFECFEHGCIEQVMHHRGRTGAGPFAQPSPIYVLFEAELTDPGPAAEQSLRERITAMLGDAAAAGEIDDATLATSQLQARELWALREDISESLHRHRPHKGDVALPVARIPEFLARWRPLVEQWLPGARALVFGHVGDGNLHLNVLPAPGIDAREPYARYDEATYGLVEALGGSISAEHGIGLLKVEHLHHSRSEPELAMMRAIKRALDPQGMFNPGKIFS
ncbi:MAG: FAD-binding oxidoreductase [Deltaproteobacteria bacterium]|nr:FAD-binding oxidoreductase [Nannocystaceae bacterium]